MASVRSKSEFGQWLFHRFFSLFQSLRLITYVSLFCGHYCAVVMQCRTLPPDHCFTLLRRYRSDSSLFSIHCCSRAHPTGCTGLSQMSSDRWLKRLSTYPVHTCLYLFCSASPIHTPRRGGA